MLALSILPRRPLCLNCIRRSIGEDATCSMGPSFIQARGKKKTAKKPNTINVRILVDMKGYGRRGTITPVAPGLMRNSWYPRQQAEYVATIRDIDPKKVVAERDFTFGMQNLGQNEASEATSDPVTQQPWPAARAELLTPEKATEILSELLPPFLIFHRTPIVEEEPEKSPEDKPQLHTRRAASRAAQETYAASEPVPSEPVSSEVSVPSSKLGSIFGSVSTLDMAETIRELLAKSEDTRRVVVGAEDIRIIGEASESIERDRLKALGNFQVEIRVNGGDAVHRTVRVVRTEA